MSVIRFGENKLVIVILRRSAVLLGQDRLVHCLLMHQILLLNLRENFFFNFASGLKYLLPRIGAGCSCLATAGARASHQLLLKLIWQRYQRLRDDDFRVVSLIHSLWKPHFARFDLHYKLDARTFVLPAAASIERVQLVTHQLH